MISDAIGFVTKNWLAIAAAALLGVIALLLVQNADLRADLSGQKEKYQKRESELNKAVADRIRDLADTQYAHAMEQQRNEDEFNTTKRKDDARISALSDDNRRLRGDVQRYTGGGRQAGETDSALIKRYSDRLTTVGTVVEQCGGLLQEGFEIVQRRDREVRILRETINADRLACEK